MCKYKVLGRHLGRKCKYLYPGISHVNNFVNYLYRRKNEREPWVGNSAI
jgi:hypothetical protein